MSSPTDVIKQLVNQPQLRNKRVAFLIDDYHHFQQVVFMGILDTFNALGMSSIVITGKEIDSWDPYHVSANKVFELAKSSDIDGILIGSACLAQNISVDKLQSFISGFEDLGKPVISLGIQVPNTPSVYIDNKPGMQTLIRHLIEVQGLKSFAFMRGFDHNLDSIERETILKEILSEYGLTFDDALITQGQFMTTDAFHAMDKFLTERYKGLDKLDFEVMVSANDDMAYGIMQALSKHGYSVPNDVAVVGFDNREDSHLQVPPLTTVRQPLFEHGRYAAQLMADMLLNKEIESYQVCFDTEIVLRKSHLNYSLDAAPKPNTASIDVLDAQKLSEQLRTRLKLSNDSYLLTLLESFVSLDDAFVKSGFEDDRFISECQHFIQNQVSDDESYLLLKSFLDFLDSEIVTPLSDFSKLAILQTRLYRVSECLSNINRKLLTDRHVANINKSYRDRYKDLRITSATNLDELFALVENYLGNSERCFIVLFNSFLSDSKDSERQGDTKPSSEHVKQFEKEHRLCFAYKDGARQTDEFDYIFENNLLLPPNLQEELQGNLFLIPLYVGDLYFGYLLIDTEDTRSVLHETLGHSIAIGIRNCVQLKKVHEHTAQLKHVNRNLAKVANYDGLTGLANRSLFSEKLEQACRSAKLTEGHVALLFLDLDGFKYINDSMGHDAGDKLLITVGKRLQSLIRDQDIVARLGGDEFTILMTDIPHASVATRLAEAVIRVFQEPYKIEGRIFQITTSIGIAVFPDDAQDSDELMKYSDAAMYKAKDDGKNRYQYYTPALNIAALERVQLGSAIRDGLRHDEFYLAYQPRLRLKDQTVIGFEALARWQDKAGNPISPERFIPIAEELALIHELGSIILEKACLQAKVWSDAGTPTVMAVNLSTKQLQDEMIVEKVLQTVDDVGLEPRWLELEITESAAMVDVENNIKKLQALRDAGIRIAIDDFGTAYSSLNYLKRLPVSSLKIDQSFVKDIQDENDISNNTAIIRAVIALGKSMGYTLVAEGVETDAQRRFLELHDCDEVQGFFFAKPLSVEDASQFLGLKNSHLQAV